MSQNSMKNELNKGETRTQLTKFFVELSSPYGQYHAKLTTMKKFLLSFVLVIAFAFYVMLSSSRQFTASVASNQPVPSAVVVKAPTSSPVASKSPSPIPSIPSIPSATAKASPKPTVTPLASKYKDGVYNGSVTDAYFGNLQVAATVNGGRLTDVAFLQYPNDRRTSQQINSRAITVLKSEAITAQSAQVDIVSGATQTSQAFSQSLAAALSKAAN